LREPPMRCWPWELAGPLVVAPGISLNPEVDPQRTCANPATT